jgi:hypothetical protein
MSYAIKRQDPIRLRREKGRNVKLNLKVGHDAFLRGQVILLFIKMVKPNEV